MAKALRIETIGGLTVRREGKALPLPASRKTRALLAYLSLTRASHSRQHLCELLWEIPDDPRASLRWSLSKLRRLVNVGDQSRLTTDGDRVGLDLQDVWVDYEEVERTADEALAPTAAMMSAWDCANAPLLEDCELSNQPEFRAWLEQKRTELVRLRVSLAQRLANHSDLDVGASDRWAERWLEDARFDAEAAQLAVRARRLTGREKEALALQRRLEREFGDAGLEVPSFSGEGLAPAPAAKTDAVPAQIPRQAIRFVHARDKTCIAWASVGDPARPPLVKAANWLNHLELDWEAPIWSPLFRELARSYRFIRYDERGCGMSDWEVERIDFESFVRDLEVVVDAAKLDRFPLLGISQGAAVSIEFAARFPERVSHLILFGGYDAGWRLSASEEQKREREAVMVLVEAGWAKPTSAYRQIFSHTFMPSATQAELDWFNQFQRQTTSAANAVRFLEAFSTIDVRDRLKDVRCPTLIVHSRGDLRIPIETGKHLAAEIPNARFAGLDSSNHLLLGRETASAEFVALVRDFVAN